MPDRGRFDVAMTRGGAGVAAVSAAVLMGAAAGPGAAAPPGATGQVDRQTPVRGQLRTDLLAASVPGRRSAYPDPGHPIVIRSTLPVAGTRVLLVAFRSLAGQPCVGVTFAHASLPATPPRCLPPCRELVCLALYRGGSLPRGTRILAGQARPQIDELRVATPSGAIRRLGVSRSRFGSPPAAPILARVAAVLRVGAYSKGVERAWVRFPA